MFYHDQHHFAWPGLGKVKTVQDCQPWKCIKIQMKTHASTIKRWFDWMLFQITSKMAWIWVDMASLSNQSSMLNLNTSNAERHLRLWSVFVFRTSRRWCRSWRHTCRNQCDLDACLKHLRRSYFLVYRLFFLIRSVFSKMAPLVYFGMKTRNFENRPGENFGPLIKFQKNFRPLNFLGKIFQTP